MVRQNQLTQLRFVGKISTMGNRKVIYIPKDFYKQAEKMQGIAKQVKVIVDDEVWG